MIVSTSTQVRSHCVTLSVNLLKPISSIHFSVDGFTSESVTFPFLSLIPAVFTLFSLNA